MKKRFIALFLVLMMMLQLAPAAVLSEETPAPTAVPYSGGIGSNVVSGKDYATVTFIAFDGTELSTLNVQLGQPIGELPEVPAREGCNIIGWKTEAGEPVTKDTVVKADMKVIASYYNYAFPALMGELKDNDEMYVKVFAPEGALPDGTFVRMETVPLTAEQKSAISEKMGADTEEISAVDIYFMVRPEMRKIQPNIPVNVTITLKNKPVEPVSVVHLTDDGQAEVVATGITEQAFDFEAKSFSVYAVVGGVTVAADDTTKLITIIYEAGEHGSVSLDQEDVYLSASTPSAHGSTATAEQGYMFTKWTYGEQDVSDRAVFVPTVQKLEEIGEQEPIGDTVTFTANFTECYNVTFLNRDNEVHQVVQVPRGQAIGTKLPPVIAREDYIAYWAVGIEEEGGSQGKEWRPGERITAEYVPTQDVTIIPDYSPVTHTVTFYKTDAQEEVLVTKSVTADTSYCLNEIPDVPEKDGYTGKWVYSGGDFNNSVVITDGMKVWPVYEKNLFTVTYKVGDSTFETDFYFLGDSLVLPSEPVVEGKDFLGWFSETGTKYEGNEKVTSDLTLTAAFSDQNEVNFVIMNDAGTEQAEVLSQYFRGTGEAIRTLPQNPFKSGEVFVKWVIKDTETEVTADTVVTGPMTVVAVFRPITVYKITAEYYYLNDGGQEVVFNRELYEAEAHELPYTITAPPTTQTDPDQVSGAPIYYPETPTCTVTEENFNNEHETTVRFKYVPYTAEYDYVYMLEDLVGNGYTEIPNSREHVYGVLNSNVTPTVKNFEYAVLQRADTALITQASGQQLPVYYTRKNFQLTYESNGGSYVGGGTYPYGSQVQLSSMIPIRTGYTFAGWYLDKDLTQRAGSTVTVNGNTTLYAKWNPNTVPYTIVYMFEKYNDTGTQSSYLYDTSRDATGLVGTTVQASSAPSITRTGWEVDTEKNRTSSVKIEADGSSVLFVYYKLSEYTLTFNRNNRGWIIKPDGSTTTNTYSFKAKIGQDISGLWPSADSYSRYFVGWQKNGQGTNYTTKQLIMNTDLLSTSYGDITYYAHWEDRAVTRTVNYYLENANDDGYTNATQYSQTYTSTGGTLNPKEITGYTYDHSQNSGNTYNFYYKRDRFKIDYFYGSTKLQTYDNVKFDANINKSPYVWTPTTTQCDVDSDYTFAGWYSDAGLTSPYTFSTMPASNLALYAKFNAPTYTVSFMDADGTTSVAASQTVEKYKKASVPEQNPTKAGYTFDNWYTSADGDELFDWNTQITADTTVYAHWTRNTLSYTVHYVDEEGDPLVPDKVVSDPNYVVGNTITEQAVTVAGYRPDVTSKSLELHETGNEITFIYSAKQHETTYNVKYILDPAEYPGTEITVAESKTENVPGDKASVIELAKAVDYEMLYAAHPELEGVEFFPDAVEKELVLSGNSASNIITFNYSPYKHAKVKVRYVDMNGAEIRTTNEQLLKVGKTFTLARPAISGWELNKAVKGTAYTDPDAETQYKITEDVTTGELVFTLYYQRKAIVTAVSSSKSYDGTPLYQPDSLNDQIQVEGLLEGDSIASVQYTYANADSTDGKGRLNAGTATVTPHSALISGAHAENPNYYKFHYASGTLDVNKINVTVRIEPDRWTNIPYDGEVKKAGFTNSTKATADKYVLISHEGYKTKYLDAIWNKIISLDNVERDETTPGMHYYVKAEKDAGTYNYTLDLKEADLPNDPNYSVKLFVRDGRLHILPKEVTVTTGSESKSYDGKPLTKDEATIDGLVDADRDKVTITATGSQTDVGKSTNTYSIEWGEGVKSSNYDITENLGTLEVTPVNLTITINDKTVPYNGAEQSGYSIPATITGTGETITMDGYTIEGLAQGQTLTIVYTPKTGTDPATYGPGTFGNISVKDTDNKAVTDYYIITTVPGNLNITDVTVTVTKRVVDALASADQEFTFTLNVQDGNGKTYTTWKPATASTTSTLPDGEAFTLKDNENIKIRVPVGKRITLTETDADLYDVIWQGATASTSTNIATVTATEAQPNREVTVTNTRKTANVVVTKVFTFDETYTAATFTPPAGFKIVCKYTDATGQAQTKELTTSDQDVSIPYSKNWTITGIPVGTDLTLTESGYDITNYEVTPSAKHNDEDAEIEDGKTVYNVTSGGAQNVTITNTYKRKEANITVTKKFVGLESDPKEDRTLKFFKITYSGNESGTSGGGELTLNNGTPGTPSTEETTGEKTFTYTWTIEKKWVGEVFTFEETDYKHNSYWVTTTPQAGSDKKVKLTWTVKETDSENLVEFTNKYELGSITIKKAVKDDNGNVLAAGNNVDYKFNIINTDTGEKFNEEVVIVKGNDNGTTVKNVPFGTYRIEEVNPAQTLEGGYMRTGNPAYSAESVTLSNATKESLTAEVTVTNTYTKVVDLTLQKFVTGNLGDPSEYFDFTVTVTGITEAQSDLIELVKGTTTVPMNWTAASEGETTGTATATITLKHGDIYNLKNLPIGASLTVSEDLREKTVEYFTWIGNAEKTGPIETKDTSKIVVVPETTETIAFTNYANIVIPTGIALDSAPYLFLMAIALLGVGLMIQRRRKENG